MTLGGFPCATSRLARRQSDWLQLHNSRRVKPLNRKSVVAKFVTHATESDPRWGWLGLACETNFNQNLNLTLPDVFPTSPCTSLALAALL